MRRKKQFLTAALCAFSMMINSAAAIAQSNNKQDPAPTTQQAPAPPNFALPAPPNRVAFVQNVFNFDGQVVKNAPYSAEAVTETIQTLADGNRIVQNFSSKIYRDSSGRTRREQALKEIGPWAVSGEAPVMISIYDPVAGVHYNLDSNTKTAHKMIPPQVALNDALKAKKLQASNGAEAGASSVPDFFFTTTTSSVTNTIVKAQSSDASLNKVPVVGGAGGAVSVITPGVPVMAGNAVYAASGKGEANQESLGKQTIEGVEAEGTRVTFTIPAGQIGNDRPIVTVNERWYSPELQTVVLSKNSDPRIGETTYKLINIDRSEPDPSLFQVPADYTVDEGPGFGPMPDLLKKLEIGRKVKKPNEN
ncbi:MAG: hypothetical protein J2P21_31160 [Chloracidobacterium sp.]|nr:hypothetical protein [Chloracidobacterium sp.]